MNECSRCHTLFAGEDVIFLGPYTLCPRCRSGFYRFMEGAPDTDMQNEILQKLYDMEQQRCRELEKKIATDYEIKTQLNRNLDVAKETIELLKAKLKECEKNMRIAEKSNDLHYDQYVYFYRLNATKRDKLMEIMRHISEIDAILKREDADPSAEMGKELGV